MYVLVGKPDQKYVNKQTNISGGDVCDEGKPTRLYFRYGDQRILFLGGNI